MPSRAETAARARAMLPIDSTIEFTAGCSSGYAIRLNSVRATTAGSAAR
jgi:hypothetical protein